MNDKELEKFILNFIKDGDDSGWFLTLTTLKSLLKEYHDKMCYYYCSNED